MRTYLDPFYYTIEYAHCTIELIAEDGMLIVECMRQATIHTSHHDVITLKLFSSGAQMPIRACKVCSFPDSKIFFQVDSGYIYPSEKWCSFHRLDL